MSFLPRASAVDLQAPYIAGFGASLLGFGILVVQADTFARQRADDSRTLEAFVAVLVTLNLAEVAASTAMVFHCLFSPLHRVPLSCGVISHKEYTFILSCSLVIATMSMCFFALKAYKITDSKVALGIMSLLVVCAAASQLSVIVLPYANARATFTWYLRCVKMAKGTAALTDVVISGIFLFELRKYRNKAQMFASTDSLVVRLRSLSLQTASVTSVGALATIAITMIPGHVALWGVAPNLLLSKLYSICTLHVLSHRRVLQAMMKGSGPYPVMDSSERRAPTSGSSATRRLNFLAIAQLGRGTGSKEGTGGEHAGGIEVHLQDFTHHERLDEDPVKEVTPTPGVHQRDDRERGVRAARTV